MRLQRMQQRPPSHHRQDLTSLALAVAALAVVVVVMLEEVPEVITTVQDRPPNQEALRIVIGLDSHLVLV
jgi:hypothetical protein